jgi:hypothetical protein
MNKLNELLRWVDRQDNWISALGHGAIVAVWMTIGLALASLSSLADDTLAMGILTFFAGMSIGAYLLREVDDARKVIGTEDEGRKLGHGFEDLLVPVVVTVALGVIYAGLI